MIDAPPGGSGDVRLAQIFNSWRTIRQAASDPKISDLELGTYSTFLESQEKQIAETRATSFAGTICKLEIVIWYHQNPIEGHDLMPMLSSIMEDLA